MSIKKWNDKLKNFCMTGLLFFPVIGIAQRGPLTEEAYKQWKMVEAPYISDGGKWVVYRMVYQNRNILDREPETMVYNTETGRSFGLKNVYNASVIAGDRYLYYKVQGIPGDTLSRDSLIFMDLQSGRKTLWDKSYPCFEVKGTNYIAWEEPLGELKRLCLWDIVRGDTVKIDSINRYTFWGQRKSILYLKGEKQEKQLYIGTFRGKHKLISGGTGGCLVNYLWGEGKEGAFTVATDSGRLEEPDLLYSFSLPEGKCRLVCDWKKVEIPVGYELDDRIYLPKNGGDCIYPRLRLKNQPLPDPDQNAEVRPQYWKWDADMIPTRYGAQPVMPFMPQYVYWVKSKKWVLLSDRSSCQLMFPDNRNSAYVLAGEVLPVYRRQMDWKEMLYYDLYLKSLQNGKEQLIIREMRGRPGWSPDGKYAIVYYAREKRWYALEIATGAFRVISDGIPYPVHQISFDKPQDAPAYGFAGWVKGREDVILYDQYDLWVVDLSGKRETYCLTREYGRQNHRELRLNPVGENKLKAEMEMNEVDLKKDVLLRSFETESKAGGFYILTPRGEVKKGIEGPYTYYFDDYSKDGEHCLWFRESYRECPELCYSDAGFVHSVRISQANPQQESYDRGNAALVKWTTFKGKENEGLLFLPEDYDTARPYPVIVVVYEQQSRNLHLYRNPYRSHSVLNVPTYVSNGYVVFMPDISYTTPGEPGEDCYDAVVSGVEMLIGRGIADRNRIGLQGHSWGGFQAVYLATRTTLFRCVQACAAVVDMISAYTAMRNDGTPRMYMYEQTQSRIGKSLWETPERYLKYSSILKADRIESPVLILHNDGDGAVPFAQGRDLFLALRRLGKPTWLLNYQGEGHVLDDPAAMKDWTVRMREFFDYYLKDQPMPQWMKSGPIN